MGMSSKKTIVGYKYGATMHMGLGMAADEVYRIDIGGKTAWSGTIKQNNTIGINQPNLFGGNKGEGGVEGNVDFMFGGENQTQNNRLVSALGNTIPAFRNTVTAVFTGFLCAMNWYPKSWEFYYRRIKSGWNNNNPWYPEKITINLADGKVQAMNPAHILYESYVSNTWGAGVPDAQMDSDAYKQVANTLYEEGFGLCFEWKATDELKKLRDFVCDHIGAVLGTDPTTGKNTIRLIRDDYKLDDLPVFDEDTGLLEIKLETTNNTEVPSQIIVKYNDAITFEERPVYANNPAICQGQRGKNTETTEYPAIPTGDLATRVAYRDLKSKTSGIKRCTLTMDRRAYDIVNGQPFRIKTKYRINNIDMVVRATRREEKFLTNGEILFSVTQDEFSLPKLSYNIIPPTPTPELPKPPVAITNSLLLEAPYRELAGLIDPANLQLLDSSSSYIFSLAEAPNSNCYNYDLITRVKGAANFTEAEDTGVWCPTAIITSEIGYTDKVIHINDSSLLNDVELGSAALIDDEIVRIDKIDFINNQLTVGRGCIDTVPAKHGEGVTIWFYDSNETTDGIEYSEGNTVETKLLSNTFRERLDQGKAATQSITIQGRQGRPYAPGNLRINGITYPSEVTGSITNITWSSRNRLLQADKLIDTTAGNIDAEDGTTYNLTVKENGAVTKQITGLTETTYSLPLTADSQRDYVLMPFDNSINDETGNAWVATGTPIYTEGIIHNKAIRFNSGDGFTHLQSKDVISGLNFGTSTDFTIEFWFKLNARNNDFMTILCNNYTSYSSATDLRFVMFYGDNALPVTSRGKIGLGGRNIGNNNLIVSSTSTIATNAWTHCAITRNKNVFTLYLNGKAESIYTGSVSFDFSLYGTVIGRNRWDSGSNGLFMGDLDQLRISKGCLYTGNFTPSGEAYTYNSETVVSKKITVELEAVRDELTSYQKHSFEFNK